MKRNSSGPGVSREGSREAGTDILFPQAGGSNTPTCPPNTLWENGSDSLLHRVFDGNWHVTEGKSGEVACGTDRTVQAPYL